MDNPFDYLKFQTDLVSLKTRFPEAGLITVAKSRMGRDIFALSAGSLKGANVIIGGFEGNDAISPSIILTFASRYFDALFSGNELSEINIKAACEKGSVIFIPCINPDGAVIYQRGFSFGMSWLKNNGGFLQCRQKDYRANAAGVELDGNFDHDFEGRRKKERLFGKYTKSPCGFSGEKAFSEPESAGLRDFLLNVKPRLVCKLSPGEGEILWRSENPHKNSHRIAKVVSSLSGYPLEAEIGSPAEGSFRQWASEKLSAPSIEIKVDERFKPCDFKKIYAELEETLAVISVI